MENGRPALAFVLVVTGLAAALLAAGCETSCDEDPLEGTEIVMSGVSEWEFEGAICPDGDQDEFEVILQPGEMLMAEVEEGDLELELHDEAGDEVTSGSPMSFTNTGTSTWFGEVHASARGTGAYHLHFRIMAP